MCGQVRWIRASNTFDGIPCLNKIRPWTGRQIASSTPNAAHSRNRASQLPGRRHFDFSRKRCTKSRYLRKYLFSVPQIGGLYRIFFSTGRLGTRASRRSLDRAVQPVASIAEARNDVAEFVELFVNGGNDDLNVAAGARLLDRTDALGRGQNADRGHFGCSTSK